MRVPNSNAAVVPRAKITGYLLSDTHPDGKHKARFFEAFGFRLDDWQALEQALRAHVANHEAAKVEPSPFGIRYVVEGKMSAPDGRSPFVRTVWFIAGDETTPRFATAYPLRRSDDA
jgi:hypothetical protein